MSDPLSTEELATARSQLLLIGGIADNRNAKVDIPTLMKGVGRLLATIDAQTAENARARVLVDEYRDECVRQTFENARLREQADALAAVVQLARNGHYWANNAVQRGNSLAYLQSRVKDLADKADAALCAYREWLGGETQ